MNRAQSSVSGLIEEYSSLLAPALRSSKDPSEADWEQLAGILEREAEWTPPGAAHVVALARDYGAFVLRNALALALALDIEDGELGL